MEAKGMAVSQYLGSHGSAEIEVVDKDGKFSRGQPNGLVEVSVKSMDIRDGSDLPLSLDLSAVLGRKEVLELEGWAYTTQIKEKVAVADIKVSFAVPISANAPSSCIAKITASGRGLASLAFKSLVVTGSGKLENVVTKA